MHRIKLKKAVLPIDFHEAVFKHEFILNSEPITIEIIRKLTFLYSVFIN
jgi:hypothetical protein